MDIFVVLLISVPIFYVWGLISFIGLFSKKESTKQTTTPYETRLNYLNQAIEELQQSITGSPDKKIADQVTKYREERDRLLLQKPVQATTIVQTETPHTENVFVEQPKHTVSSPSFQNWYKDNSINLLLYIGAFLIVVSATIYVGLPQASGVSKGLLLSLLTLVFYGSGLWFSTMPKIKNAGNAFAGVGALLIPITGVGWYNFVFQYTTVSIGLVWFVTSLIAFGGYFLLARYFKSIFYAYVTSFSTLSLTFALVNMQGLHNNFYVLASIMSSILLLLLHIVFKTYKTESLTLLHEPFYMTANVVVPVALTYGILMQSGETTIPLETPTSLLLSCIFYIMSYLSNRNPYYVLAIESLFTMSLGYFLLWMAVPTLTILLVVSMLVFMGIAVTKYFKDANKIEESHVSAAFAVILSIILFILAFSANLEPLQILYFEFVPCITAIVIAKIVKIIPLLSVALTFVGLMLRTFANDILGYEQQPYVLGFLYTTAGSVWYTLAVMFKSNKKALTLFALACISYFLISTTLIADRWDLQIVNFLCLAIISYSCSYRFAKKEFIYLGNFFVGGVVSYTLKQFQVGDEFFPPVLVSLSLVFYLLHLMIPDRYKMFFRNSGLLGSFIIVLIFGAATIGADMTITSGAVYNLQLYSLVCSYATALLFGYDAYTQKSSQIGYTASALVLLTYLWQIHFLGATEMLYYTIPIGLYFFGLAYLQRKAHDQSLRHVFDYVALFFLIVPTWTLSFGENGMLYAVVLGIIGIALLTYSITYNEKLFRYAALIAIVLAVTSQSRWAIIGLAGVGFLGLALYLLIFRKEEKQ